jgi:hypothetical protein
VAWGGRSPLTSLLRARCAPQGRVTIASAQLEMQKGEVERALTMLRAIQQSSPHYNAARKVTAGPQCPCPCRAALTTLHALFLC